MTDILDADGAEAAAELKAQYGDDRVDFLRVDITNIHEVESLFKEIVRRYKRLDVGVGSLRVYSGILLGAWG